MPRIPPRGPKLQGTLREAGTASKLARKGNENTHVAADLLSDHNWGPSPDQWVKMSKTST